MTRFVSPPIDQHKKLRQQLTVGEQMVFNFFNSNLSEEWEIYLQPHLNGLRPDFVLLNPNSGIAVFEIKDWDFTAMHYWIEERKDKAPILLASKDGKQFSRQNDNPVEKIYKYKQEIFDLYCPRLQQRFGFAVITAGIIFTKAPENAVKQLFQKSLEYRGMTKYPQYNPLSGVESLQSGNLKTVFPEGLRAKSLYMSDDMANDFRNWLIEPDFAKSQRMPLELDNTQLSFVKSRTQSGYRRIKGPAGSGKSLVLAARAAELLKEDKNILVVTYNITLLHYLMDIAVRWGTAGGKTRTLVTWLNFHSWCKRVHDECDRTEQYSKFWQEVDENNSAQFRTFLNEVLPGFVNSLLDDSKTASLIQKYDAILVDEGQDFLPSWWNILRKICTPGGEMLLVADATQDIYETARSWTDEAMTGAGFLGGRWAELKVSYRLPPNALEAVRVFAELFLPKDTLDMPAAEQLELDIFPCFLKWIHTTPEKAISTCEQAIMDMAPNATPEILAISDITFLSNSQCFGLEVINALNKTGMNTVHTFSMDTQESRRKKMGFYMGDARIKATTLHSFKGWESRALVIFIGERVTNKDLALVYTGLTRLKRHLKGSYLTVVSCAERLKEYGKYWDYQEI
jgi:hypothetical protein